MSSINLLSPVETSIPSVQKKRKETDSASESPSSVSAVLNKLRKQGSKGPLNSADSLQNTVDSIAKKQIPLAAPQNFSIKRKKTSSIDDANRENYTPVPQEPLDYHYENFYEQANEKLLTKVFKTVKNKEFQTIAPDDSREDANLLRIHYGKLSKEKEKSLAKPVAVKADPDTSIEISEEGFKVSRKSSTRVYKVHENKKEGQQSKLSLYPHTGDGFVTVAGSELEELVRTYKRESPRDVKFLKFLEIRVRSKSRSAEEPSPIPASPSEK